MLNLTCIENNIDQNLNYYSSFLIDYLEIGQGITLANCLRRTLLTEIMGYAITSIKINNVEHDFTLLNGIGEDLIEILLNITNIHLKSFQFFENYKIIYGFIYIKGPLIISAGMLKLPKNSLQILNPAQYICAINNNSEFFLEVSIEKGKRIISTSIFSDLIPSEISNTLILECKFSPIKKINYRIRILHDDIGNFKESLFFELITNGSILPKRALQDALKFLLNLFYPIINKRLMIKLSHKFRFKILQRLKLKKYLI